VATALSAAGTECRRHEGYEIKGQTMEFVVKGETREGRIMILKRGFASQDKVADDIDVSSYGRTPLSEGQS
jgi:hypothetical protein